MPRKRWPHPEALTTAQAAHHVGLATSTLEKLRGKAGSGGPAWLELFPKAIRYRVADLDAWLESKSKGRGGPPCRDCPHRERPAG